MKQVEQITFNGKYAHTEGQEVLYCTERALFKLTGEGIELIEIAPGVDLEKDILSMMDFEPKISPNLKEMSSNIFASGLLGLKKHFDDE